MRRGEYEALTHAQFVIEVRGAEWRWQRMEDLAAMVSLHVIAAAGGGKKEDGSYLTPADLLGREPVRLIDARLLTAAEAEAQEWAEQEAEAKRARANLFLYEMAVRKAQREGAPGPTIVSG